MQKRSALAAILVLVALASWAATPEASPDSSLTTFRVTTAEVHVTFTAVLAKNQRVSSLTAADFTLLRDGLPIDQIVSFSRDQHAPLAALVLTDVSDSMMKALPMERSAADWLRANSTANDHLVFRDFGYEIETDRMNSAVNRQMTSLYDALIETLPQTGNTGGRRALILLSDGADNYSYHSLLDVIALAQRLDVAIYAITAHGKNQYYRPDLLQKLCDDTGGKYYDVRKLEGMLSAISNINDDLRNGFEVVFRPAVAGAGMHQLSMESHERGLRFFHRAAYYQPPSSEEITSVR